MFAQRLRYGIIILMNRRNTFSKTHSYTTDDYTFFHISSIIPGKKNMQKKASPNFKCSTIHFQLFLPNILHYIIQIIITYYIFCKFIIFLR